MTSDTFSALSIIVSLVLVALGWRVKYSQDTKISTLNSKLDMQLHKGKLTFEKEFEILSQLWNAFVDVYESSLALNAAWDRVSPNATDEITGKEREERLKTFGKHYIEFWNIVRKNRPFYPQEIYEMMTEFNAMTQEREVLYSYNPPSVGENPGYWDSVSKLSDWIRQVNEDLCTAIRNSYR